MRSSTTPCSLGLMSHEYVAEQVAKSKAVAGYDILEVMRGVA